MSTTRQRRQIVCLICSRLRPHIARGLCGMCYKRCEANDTLDDYAPARRSALQVVEDYEFINEMHGGTLKQIAERMGMRYDALWVILKRNGIKHVNRLA